MDYLQFIFQAINNLLTQNLGFFDSMGQNLFRSFATILVVWYGVKSALSSAGGRHFLHFDNFASLLLTVSFGFAMVNYYSAPIPGVGTSFHNLITDESQFLANKINQTELQTVEERIADFETRMDSPGITDVLGTAMYVVIIILLAAAQAKRAHREGPGAEVQHHSLKELHHPHRFSIRHEDLHGTSQRAVGDHCLRRHEPNAPDVLLPKALLQRP